MGIISIRRDPFARATLMRATRSHLHGPWTNQDRECRWCGSPKPRFAYRWEDDNYNAANWIGMFCGLQCFLSYTCYTG